MNIGKYVGYDPDAYAQAAQGAQTIKQTKAASKTNVNPAAAAQALANQTGGNIMGFTYE